MIRYHILAAFAGCALDALFGDPRNIPHPVCGIGNLIAWLEARLRKWFPANEKSERRAGTALVVAVLLITGLASLFVLAAAYTVHPLAGVAVESVMCGQMMAWRSLKKESMKVYDALAAGDTEGARTAVSMIVGRDTKDLTDLGITKAAVETVAENFSDGVAAPLFYFFLGGAPLALCYKAINTMDSMVGYRNERYLYFGRWAARLDDGANWLPARLSALLLVAAAWLLGEDGRGAWRIWRRDRRNHASPNAAQTEAAMAGALGVQLAGPAWYFGIRVEKPTIGEHQRPIVPEDILRSNRLLYGGSVLCLGVLIGLRCALVLGGGIG